MPLAGGHTVRVPGSAVWLLKASFWATGQGLPDFFRAEPINIVKLGLHLKPSQAGRWEEYVGKAFI